MSRLPFDLSIPTPCHQPWHEMSGSGTHRHCASCDKTVHNLATLTPRQIERLIDASNGHLCARVTRRQDGSVVTADSRSVQASFSSAFVLASALAAIPAIAQDAAKPQAVVTGTVLTPKNNQYIHSDSPREVLFIQNDKVVLNTTTDATGKFTAPSQQEPTISSSATARCGASESRPSRSTLDFRSSPLSGNSSTSDTSAKSTSSAQPT